MLSIRLRRAGATRKPHYRVVVADSREPRDGRFVEVLGHYDPRKDPAIVKIDTERTDYWIGKGAQPSDTVLPAAVPFLAVATLSRALARRFEHHKRIARWTLPIWLYVSVTGVVVYWMLYQMRF